jgi:transposase
VTLIVQDWAEIRRLHQCEGMPIRQIARVLGISRNTVRNALAANGSTKYARRRTGSVVDAVEPKIRDLLTDDPRMPASIIAERIGWTRGMTVLRERVAQLRPTYLPVDQNSPIAYVAGDIAQCDLWFPGIELPAGAGQTRAAKALPVLVMVCAYSQWVSALLIPSRSAGDLYAGWWRLIAGLGACPRTFVWDGESAVGRWHRGRTELTEQCQAFRDALSTKVIVCGPGDPDRKSLVAQAKAQLQTGFLSGRRFDSPADFNHQLTDWLAVRNGRPQPGLGGSPADRLAADRAAMLTLPAVTPFYELSRVNFRPLPMGQHSVDKSGLRFYFH